MSDALAVSNSAPNFPQQGSVDWVSLGGSTFSFSLEVLSRFSKAGVDMLTVAIGQTIFSSFKVPPTGQRRLFDAISKLKAFSSYGKVLWFGFGIKPVVKSLCETEQGSACAAICACLSVSYDLSYSSQVMKELADMSLAPTTLTPALSQWAALVNACAGAVTDSQFPVLVEGFSSILGAPSRGREIRALQEPTIPNALARAIQELSKVSNGIIRSVTLEGGADCGWLAAVAQWLLGLRVEIIDVSGIPLYSEIAINSKAEAQVTIIRNISDTQANTTVLSRSFVVPPGALCFRLAHASISDSTQHLFSKGRSNWSSILRNTFGLSVQDLLGTELAPIFSEFLCSSISAAAISWAHIGMNPWGGSTIITDEHHRAQNFLLFATQRLPEMASVLQAVREDPAIIDRAIDGAAKAEKLSGDTFPTVLRDVCHCEDCIRYCKSRSFQSYAPLKRPVQNLCLERIAITIFEYIWTLSWLDIDESIKPSSSGLTMMYFTHRHGDSRPSQTAGQIFERGIDVSLFSLFTGLTDTNQQYPRSLSAACENGLCIYQNTLKQLDVGPFQVLRLQVVPGQIYCNERTYNRICDQGAVLGTSFSQSPPSTFIKTFGPCPRLEFVVEETVFSSQLKGRFCTSSQSLPSQYIDLCKNISNRVPYDRWPFAHDTQMLNPNFGPGSCWRNTRFRYKSYHKDLCKQQDVNISITNPPHIAASFTSWTGKCSQALQAMRTVENNSGNSFPGDDEWVLVDTFLPGTYTEVVRGRFPFIYSVICNLDVASRVQLVCPNPCFICMARIHVHDEQRIIVHSFLDERNPTIVEIICRSKPLPKAISVQIDVDAALEDPSKPSTSSAPTRRTRSTQKRRKFEDEKVKRRRPT